MSYWFDPVHDMTTKNHPDLRQMVKYDAVSSFILHTRVELLHLGQRIKEIAAKHANLRSYDFLRTGGCDSGLKDLSPETVEAFHAERAALQEQRALANGLLWLDTINNEYY